MNSSEKMTSSPPSQQFPETIQKMFSRIANQYDKGNAILSCNTHHKWNRRLVLEVLKHIQPRAALDLCSGTGEVALHITKLYPQIKQLHLIDFCADMLEHAKDKFAQRTSPEQVTIQVGDAMDIPLPNNHVNAVTIAYGIRNIQTPLRCLEECYRVLAPQGVLGILELTEPKNRMIRLLHKIYLNHILPGIGRCISKDREAYTYLSKSIQQFTSPQALAKQIEQAGFETPQRIPLMGGIAHIFIARSTKEG